MSLAVLPNLIHIVDDYNDDLYFSRMTEIKSASALLKSSKALEGGKITSEMIKMEDSTAINNQLEYCLTDVFSP